MVLLRAFTAFALLFGVAIAAPSSQASPTVELDSATFTGVHSGSVSKFLGIPFAQPP